MLIDAYINEYPEKTSDRNITQFNFLWALQLATGKKIILTYAGMMEVLAPFPALKEAYLQELDRDTEPVILAHIRKINNSQ